jgi:hypothetical protein
MVSRLPVFVTKADGSRQFFDREKVVRTCLRMGASRQMAYEVAGKVERRLYDGIPTAKVLQLVFFFMRRQQPRVSYPYDLRKGMSLMSPKPEFEEFIQLLLSNNGFEVDPNKILVGNCGEHEVDAVARKDGVTYFVEAKHHFNYHALTGLDESRIARAILEDVTEAYESGKISQRFDRAMIITNTKYSEHAVNYGSCRNILQIGWNTPVDLSVQHMIETTNLYPLSCLKDLKRDARAQLASSGIVVMKQLINEDLVTLSRKTGVPKQILENIREQAEKTVLFEAT